MNLNQIDNYFIKVLSKYVNTERRDYKKLEKTSPEYLKGYGDKYGLMYLIDIDGDHYIDVTILSDKIKISFRKDDYRIINLSIKHSDNIEEYYNSFDSLVEEYYTFLKRAQSLSRNYIPIDLKRNFKIDSLNED